MKKLVLSLFLLLSLYQTSFADVGIFIKIAVDNSHYSSLVIQKPENLKGKFKFFTHKINENTFNFTKIRRDFYQVNIKYGMTYMKVPIKIYELNPAFNDRFIHILWVVDDFIIRREIYNLNKKLMSAHGYVDGLPDIIIERKKKQLSHGEKYLSANFDLAPFEYRGFKVMYAKKSMDGIKHILFSDGLNKFSVFVQKIPVDYVEGVSEVKRIIMGNNIMRGKINNELFTVVGTIPFTEMQEVMSFVEKKKEEQW